jgi:hypothetical protein
MLSCSRVRHVTKPKERMKFRDSMEKPRIGLTRMQKAAMLWMLVQTSISQWWSTYPSWVTGRRVHVQVPLSNLCHLFSKSTISPCKFAMSDCRPCISASRLVAVCSISLSRNNASEISRFLLCIFKRFCEWQLKTQNWGNIPRPSLRRVASKSRTTH